MQFAGLLREKAAERMTEEESAMIDRNDRH
jgi:hypothetical protein